MGSVAFPMATARPAVFNAMVSLSASPTAIVCSNGSPRCSHSFLSPTPLSIPLAEHSKEVDSARASAVSRPAALMRSTVRAREASSLW